METLTFPRWKGEHTRRAAHAPRRRVLRGLQEAHVAGCLPRRCRGRCRAGESCHTPETGRQHANLVVGRRCRECHGHALSYPRRGHGRAADAATHVEGGEDARTHGGAKSGDSGASRRSAHRREQRRRNGSRRQMAVSFGHWCRERDVGLRVELVPFYRHAFPMRTARPDAA